VVSPEGLVALGVGLQNRFGTATGNLIYSAGLVTDELGAIGTAFSTISDAQAGVVPPGAGFVSDIWSSEYRTVKAANDIIFNAPNVAMPRGTRSGLLGLAYLAKGGAIGELTMAYQKVAITTYNTATPAFVDRATALTYAIALLDSGTRAYADTAPSATFTTQVLAPGLNIPNTLLAYKARYRRMLATSAADWQAVIAVADSVDRTVFSVLPYSATVANPVFALSTGSSGVLPRDIFRTSDPSEAQRTAYFVTPANIIGRDPNFTPLDAWNVFGTAAAPIPAYYPDEVLLIKAEALANLGRFPEAKAVLDSVRTDCPGAGRVTTDPGPCLTPYGGPLTQADLLTEIYRNRRYELFATGLRWEDLRRRGPASATATLKRCWLPYPITERNANPLNVPPDPEGTEPVGTPTQCL
jgi:hypothetical protein